MNVKNIGLFEQHVEKIVLGVAAAGAIYMGYLAFQPITVPGVDPPVAAGDVDNAVKGDVEKMQAAIEANKKQAEGLSVQPTAFHIDPKELIGKPLPQVVLGTQAPLMFPANAPVVRGVVDVQQEFKIVTPAAPDPIGITVETYRGLVADVPAPLPGATGAPAAVTPGTPPLKVRDQYAVRIQGYYPLGRFQADLMDPKLTDKERLPDASQKAAIAKIHVQRQEYTGGKWSDWTDVPASKASPAPTDIAWLALDWAGVGAAIDKVEAEFKQIVLPDFYVDDSGKVLQPTILTRPFPTTVKALADRLADEIGKDRGHAGAAQPANWPPAAGPDGTVPPPADVGQLKNDPVVPFCFWDETVKPNGNYRYRVQVELANPTLAWGAGLAVPPMKIAKFIDSSWVQTGQVNISPDIVFFVTGGPGAPPDVRIFKFQGGRWYYDVWTTLDKGSAIRGTVKQIGGPPMDADTQYSIVDLEPASDGTVNVVLMGPKGDLETRNSKSEQEGANEKYDETQMKTGPTTAPGGGGAPTPPTAPPGRGPGRGPTTRGQ